MGRLLAVADGFDAMTSDRPYRPGMPKEKALAILTDGAGTQWDRDLALAFVDLMRDRPLLKSEPEEAIS
jgi:HD-GYP domain-containing protein (c-di-GMP phosphodiesterase class II)